MITLSINTSNAFRSHPCSVQSASPQEHPNCFALCTPHLVQKPPTLCTWACFSRQKIRRQPRVWAETCAVFVNWPPQLTSVMYHALFIRPNYVRIKALCLCNYIWRAFEWGVKCNNQVHRQMIQIHPLIYYFLCYAAHTHKRTHTQSHGPHILSTDDARRGDSSDDMLHEMEKQALARLATPIHSNMSDGSWVHDSW